MSAGQFTIVIYQADSGETHFLKQQPESGVFSLDGVPNQTQAGPPTSPFWAETNRGARQYGLRPRKMRFRFDSGQEPAGYLPGATYDIPVYSKGVYDGAVIGSKATYLGNSGTLVGRKGESIYPEV
jgi:hypothetical protein